MATRIEDPSHLLATRGRSTSLWDAVEGQPSGERIAEPLRIVVAVDFSPAAATALRWATQLAAGRPARIVALHAVEPSILALPPGMQAFLEHRAREQLRLAVAPLVDRGLDVVVEAHTGRPWEVLAEACEFIDPAVVVMGSRGLSATRRAFLGSNTDRALRSLTVPVLVVHEGDEPPERVHALVATDFSRDAGASVDALARLFGRSRLRLHATMLHVAVPPQVVDYADIPIAPTFDWPSIEESARRELDDAGRALAAIGVDVHPVVLRGTPARSILRETSDSRADLVVVGRRPSGAVARWLLGSTAERVLHGARCAVLSAQAVRVAAPQREAAAAGRAVPALIT